ncbi:acyl-CoA N-acyltransferase [Hymenopellis radicata]|nr:acyl-CoA N-acyltransferase [Hymenopellis radicata]
MGLSVHIRKFERADLQAVQQLILSAAMQGKESPYRGTLDILLAHPITRLAGVALAGDIVFVAPKHIVAAAVVAGAIVAPLVLQWRLLVKDVRDYFEEGLRKDLNDISKHYQQEKEGSAHVRAGGFWVAEVESPSTSGSYDIAGCVGLEHLNSQPKGQLRRMFVSHNYRNRGIAKMLLQTLVEHAKAKGLTSLYLGTTMAQPAAVSFYEKHGWKRIPTPPGVPRYYGVGLVKVDLLLYGLDLY